MTELVVILVVALVGGGIFLLIRRGQKRSPHAGRWLVAATDRGEVWADPWKNPPLVKLRRLYDEARRRWAADIGDAPDIFDEIRWWWVPDEYCDPKTGRFPVPWRGRTVESRPGVVYTSGWTVRSARRTAVSRGMTDETIIKECGNQMGVYKEDDPAVDPSDDPVAGLGG